MTAWKISMVSSLHLLVQAFRSISTGQGWELNFMYVHMYVCTYVQAVKQGCVYQEDSDPTLVSTPNSCYALCEIRLFLVGEVVSLLTRINYFRVSNRSWNRDIPLIDFFGGLKNDHLMKKICEESLDIYPLIENPRKRQYFFPRKKRNIFTQNSREQGDNSLLSRCWDDYWMGFFVFLFFDCKFRCQFQVWRRHFLSLGIRSFNMEWKKINPPGSTGFRYHCLLRLLQMPSRNSQRQRGFQAQLLFQLSGGLRKPSSKEQPQVCLVS